MHSVGNFARARAMRAGFTLVELLVVIAIIGILVALLLPAVQAAREAARRTQCKNQVRQMILSIHNHVDAKQAFPSGGIYPWPPIEYYVTNGKPYSLGEQGLSWAYQILPYLEEGPVQGVTTTPQIEQAGIGMYFCPSRRSPTQDILSAAFLMDYATAVPNRSRGQFPGSDALYNAAYLKFHSGKNDTNGCVSEQFWGAPEAPIHRKDFLSKNDLKSAYAGFHGVIIRSNRWVMPNGGVRETGFYTPITFAKITDGSSKTLVLGEKFLRPSLYQQGDWHDDRGWSDGWDPDTLRCTICQIMQDRELINSNENRTAGFRFGSAHPSGMNAAFADGSVRTINYDVDQELFNLMGNRKDGDLGGKELTEVAPR